jgi:hypothetical protein
MMRHKLSTLGGIESLVLVPYLRPVMRELSRVLVWEMAKTEMNRMPPSTKDLARLKEFTMEIHPESEYFYLRVPALETIVSIQMLPKSLTRLKLLIPHVLRCFFNDQFVKISKVFPQQHLCDLEVLVALDTYNRLVHQVSPVKDPWIPLETLLPCLTHLTLDGSTNFSVSQVGIVEDALDLFMTHLPASLVDLEIEAFSTAQPRFLRFLPRSLVSWSSTTPFIRSLSQLTFHPFFSADSASMLPNSITKIVLTCEAELNAFSSLVNLTYLDVDRWECVGTCAPLHYLPRNLTYFKTSRIPILSLEGIPPGLEHLLLPTNCIVPNNWTLYLPNTLKTLLIRSDNASFGISVRNLPKTLTSFHLFSEDLPNPELASFSPTIQSLSLNINAWRTTSFTNDQEIKIDGFEDVPIHLNPLSTLPCLRSLTKLTTARSIGIRITSQFLRMMPNIQRLVLPGSAITDRELIALPPHLSYISVSEVIIYGQLLKLHPEVLNSESTLTRLTLQDSFFTWQIAHSRISVFYDRLVFGYLEYAPEGIQSLKNLKWMNPNMKELPSTITELVQLDLPLVLIPSLPPALTSLIGPKFIIDVNDSERLASLIPKDVTTFSIPWLLLQSVPALFPHISFVPFSNSDEHIVRVDDRCLAFIPPTATSLIIANDHDLTSACFEFVPPGLRTLTIHHSRVSSLFFKHVPKLVSLEELNIVPSNETIADDLKKLPRSLKTLKLYQDLNSKDELHIPLSSIDVLPQLTHLAIFAPNDLRDNCIPRLPRYLQRLTLNSSGIIDPVWHTFPIPLQSLKLAPSYPTAPLIDYFKKRRKRMNIRPEGKLEFDIHM